MSCAGDAGIGFDFEYSIRMWRFDLRTGIYYRCAAPMALQCATVPEITARRKLGSKTRSTHPSWCVCSQI